MLAFLLPLTAAFAVDPAPTGIVVNKVADIYPYLPPAGATKWDAAPLIAAINESLGTFTPKDVYELIDRKVRPEVIKPVAAKASIFYDPAAMLALSDQQAKARGSAMSQTLTLDPATFVQLFEFFSDAKNDITTAEARVAGGQPRADNESQNLYERRMRTREEQLVKARGPYEGRIQNTTFAVTLNAAVTERDGCSRAIASWDAASVSFDLFRVAMGTTKASAALVTLTNSPTIEKAQFTVEGTRRFEIVGRCGTTGTKARITMSRTPEGAWSGAATL